MWNTVRLDFGESLSAYPAEVWEIIRPAIGWSIGLIGVSVLITFALGITVGALLAWKGTPKIVKAVLPMTMIGGVLLSHGPAAALSLAFSWALPHERYDSGIAGVFLAIHR